MTLCQIDLRDRRWYGYRVVQDVPALPPAAFLRGTLVVLVHGYATNHADAERRYREFVKHTERASRKRLVFLAIHWPGDHPWGDWPSKLTFSLRLKPAKESAARIVSLLEKSYARSVMFVGHSLGCRVVLSAMASLGSNSRARVQSTYLMAAAVPEADCWDSADFSRANLPQVTQIVRSSQKDKVLQKYFRPGMFLARGFSPGFGRNGGRAVGRAGGPPGRWTGGWWATSTELYHENYWVSQDMARQFTIATGNARANTSARRLIRSSVVSTREIGTRAVGGRR
jgi:pimeloyl-ACP methyl ester carboxylesterase